MKYDKAVSKDVGRLILLHLMAEFMGCWPPFLASLNG